MQAGRIDLLVNNAGYAQAGPIEETSLSEVQARDHQRFLLLLWGWHSVGVLRMGCMPALRGGQVARVERETCLPRLNLTQPRRSACPGGECPQPVLRWLDL